jgi:hypothetical protein
MFVAALAVVPNANSKLEIRVAVVVVVFMVGLFHRVHLEALLKMVIVLMVWLGLAPLFLFQVEVLSRGLLF